MPNSGILISCLGKYISLLGELNFALLRWAAVGLYIYNVYARGGGCAHAWQMCVGDDDAGQNCGECGARNAGIWGKVR